MMKILKASQSKMWLNQSEEELMKDEETARVIRQFKNSTDSDSDSEEDEFEQPPSQHYDHHHYNFIITINMFTNHSMQSTQKM